MPREGRSVRSQSIGIVFLVSVRMHTNHRILAHTVKCVKGKTKIIHDNYDLGYYSRPIEGVNSNLRSPMLNSLREWGERRSTRVFALKTAQRHVEFEAV